MRLAGKLIMSLLLVYVSALADDVDPEAMGAFLWVPCYQSNNVYKVSVRTHEVTDIIPVGSGPAGVAVGPSMVYVTCRNSSRLYCISKLSDTAIDSFELGPELAFGIGVALDPDNHIYVVGRVSYSSYEMSMARLLKLDPDGTVLASLDLVQVQGDNWYPDWNQMAVIGIAIDDPEIMLPWQRSWDVNTGIIITDTAMSGLQCFPFNPRIHGYRGPGAAYDREDRGWSSGDREGLNYLIGHRLPDFWGYYQLGTWDNSGQIYGDVAVDQLGYIWTGSGLGYLMRFDPISCAATSYQLGPEIKGIAIDRYGYIWVALCTTNTLMKFDSEGNQVGSPVLVGEAPMGFGDMSGYEYGRRMTAIEEDYSLPGATSLMTAYPNPFNTATQICYSLSKSGPVKLAIYNLLGQKVTTLHDGFRDAGDHAVIWDATGLPSGLYFARLESGNNPDCLKISLVK